jgi:hypothetical protein
MKRMSSVTSRTQYVRKYPLRAHGATTPADRK